jgi:hypothetical protein
MVGACLRIMFRKLSKRDVTCFMAIYMFLLMSFSVSNVENFLTNYVVLAQATSIIITDHMLTIHVFRNVISVLHSEFSTIYHIVS